MTENYGKLEVRALEEYNYEVVIIHIGINDILRCKNNEALDTFPIYTQFYILTDIPVKKKVLGKYLFHLYICVLQLLQILQKSMRILKKCVLK